MKRIFFSTILSLFSYYSFCQNIKVSEFALSQTLIYNKTTVYDSYSGARAADKSGTAISNGINLTYSKTIYKNLYGKIGIGYFKQKFGIHRGFDFEQTVATTNLFYSTKYYSYHSFNYFGGVGYNKILSKNKSKILPQNSALRLLAVYNFFNTYKQEFKHDFDNDNLFGNINPQIRKESYSLGNSIILQAGILRPIFKNFGIGLDLLVPVYNKWRKDKIFRENTDEFHGSDFSVGTSINLIYNIKN
ncbi:MAG: hypothetical protein ABL872_11700 [Lacibacter sp.]